MSGFARGIAIVVGLVVLGVGVYFLRDETISRHTPQDPGSRLEVVMVADLHGAEAGQTVDDYAWSKVLMCRTEVALADPITELEPVDRSGGVFRFVLQPSLDDTDRTQFRGCLHDWNVDHLDIDVLEMNDLPPG